MIKKQLGGDRLGSGNKMTVGMHGYGKSTHNLSRVRRTSMSIGTLVPMGTWLLLPGDSVKLQLDALITSNALLYQCYGSMKFQVDVFTSRIALYQPKMLLNLNDAGLDVSDIKFPQLRVGAQEIDWEKDPSNQQINPSAALRYLGIAGVGQKATAGDVIRNFNAIPKLMYTDIYKEYYANKQEGIGVVIHTEGNGFDVTGVTLDGDTPAGIPEAPITGTATIDGSSFLRIYFDPAFGEVVSDSVIINVVGQGDKLITDLFDSVNSFPGELQGTIPLHEGWVINNWRLATADETRGTQPHLKTFDLKNVDKMRMQILGAVESAGAYIIDDEAIEPYGLDLEKVGDVWAKTINQEGLFVKTYQSDIFNNWLNTEWIDNINNRSTVNTSGDEFTIDSLLITQKAYNYLNRVAVADGTLDSWREVTYAHRSTSKSLKPIYEGGLSKEILFDMIVSTAGTDDEPLGSIASRGQFGNKHKGGDVRIKVDEESYMMVIASITPRIVYNQGNRWDMNLKSLDDLHKPEFDRIGFQNLITDHLCFWDTTVIGPDVLTTRSAGKQPAWMWYKTDYDDALGNMASSEDYKVLGRSYGWDRDLKTIADVTTYIDPVKFNDIFAIKSLDAMNFDVQVGMDLTIRRVMSAEAMPNM